MRFKLAFTTAIALSIFSQSNTMAGSADVTCSNGCNKSSFDTDFCSKMEGGMSSNPDGSYTCSVSTSKAQRAIVKLSQNTTRRASTPNTFSSNERKRDVKAGVIYECEGDQKYCSTQFVNTCTISGGSPSTSPDGTVTCEVEPNSTQP